MKPKNERGCAHTCSEKKFMNPMHMHKKKFLYPHTEIKFHVPTQTDKRNSSTRTHIGRILKKPINFSRNFRPLILLLIGIGLEVHTSCNFRIKFITIKSSSIIF